MSAVHSKAYAPACAFSFLIKKFCNIKNISHVTVPWYRIRERGSGEPKAEGLFYNVKSTGGVKVARASVYNRRFNVKSRGTIQRSDSAKNGCLLYAAICRSCQWSVWSVCSDSAFHIKHSTFFVQRGNKNNDKSYTT